MKLYIRSVTKKKNKARKYIEIEKKERGYESVMMSILIGDYIHKYGNDKYIKAYVDKQQYALKEAEE